MIQLWGRGERAVYLEHRRPAPHGVISRREIRTKAPISWSPMPWPSGTTLRGIKSLWSLRVQNPLKSNCGPRVSCCTERYLQSWAWRKARRGSETIQMKLCRPARDTTCSTLMRRLQKVVNPAREIKFACLPDTR